MIRSINDGYLIVERTTKKKKKVSLETLYSRSKIGIKWKNAAKDMIENKCYYFIDESKAIYRIKDYILEYYEKICDEWIKTSLSSKQIKAEKWYKATLKTSKKLKYGKD